FAGHGLTFGGRQSYVKGAAEVESFTFRPDFSGVHLNDLPRDGQAESKSRLRWQPGMGPLTEGLKDLLEKCRVDTGSRVSDLHRRFAVDQQRANRDNTAGFGILDRIYEQVHHDLLQPDRVPEKGNRLGPEFGGQLELL